MFTKTKELCNYIAGELRRIIEEEKQFIENFQRNPVCALSWSYAVFRDASRKNAIKIVLQLNEQDNMSIPQLKEYVNEQLVKSARNGSSNVSPVQNLVNECNTVAWVWMFDNIKRHAE